MTKRYKNKHNKNIIMPIINNILV